MEDMWKYVTLVGYSIAPGSRILAISVTVFGLLLLLPGFSYASIKAEMHIPRGSRVNMFDLYNMKGVECSVSGTGMFRSKDIDISRRSDCPHQVWIMLDDWKASIRFNPSSHSATLKSWMKEKPGYYSPHDGLKNVTVDTGVPDFDFVMFDDSTNEIRIAVYNNRDDVTRPRFFYSQTPLSLTALHDSLTNPSTATTFQEADMMWIRLVFNDTCDPVLNHRMYNTCAEALDTEYCPCDCAYYDKLKYWEDNSLPVGLTEEEKKETVRPEMEATKKQLTVNKTDLSSFRNTKISASDHRSSAKGLGMLGAVMLGLVFGSLVLCDLVSLKRHANNVQRNCSCLKT